MENGVPARGYYEYLVMPYGLTNAPAVFQAFMNELFHDMINRFLIVYIDDLLVYSHSMEEHVQQVRLVLQHLQANRLFVNAEKSLFHVSTLTSLGYVLTPGGVAMDQAKVDAVCNWHTPNTVKDLQRFLGFSNYYRRFIRNFGATAYRPYEPEKRQSSMVRRGPEGFRHPQTSVHLGPGADPTGPRPPVHCRGGRFRRRGRGCSNNT